MMFNGIVESLAAMIWSRTTFAASMRACRSSREEAAEAVHAQTKLRQTEAINFFIPILSAPLAVRRRGGLLDKQT
jgi:uncharacterized protein YpmB